MAESKSSESIVVPVLYAAFLSAVVAIVSSVHINNYAQLLTLEGLCRVVSFVASFLFASLYFMDELILRSKISPRQHLTEVIIWIMWVVQIAAARHYVVMIGLGGVSATILLVESVLDNSEWKVENAVWLLFWLLWGLVVFVPIWKWVFVVLGIFVLAGLMVVKVWRLWNAVNFNNDER